MPKLIGVPVLDTSYSLFSGRTVLCAGAVNPATNRWRHLVDPSIAVGDASSVPAIAGYATDYGDFSGDFSSDVASGTWADSTAKMILCWFPVWLPSGETFSSFANLFIGLRSSYYGGGGWSAFPRAGNLAVSGPQVQIIYHDPATGSQSGTGFIYAAAAHHDQFMIGTVVDGVDDGTFGADQRARTDSAVQTQNAASGVVPDVVQMFGPRQYNDPKCLYGWLLVLDDVVSEAEFNALFADPLAVFGAAPTLSSFTQKTDTTAEVVWDRAVTYSSGTAYRLRSGMGGGLLLDGINYSVSGSGTDTHTITLLSGSFTSSYTLQTLVDVFTSANGRGNNAYSETAITIPPLSSTGTRGHSRNSRERNPR